MFRAVLQVFLFLKPLFQVVITAEVCSGQFLEGFFLKTFAFQVVVAAEVCSGQFLKGFFLKPVLSKW